MIKTREIQVSDSSSVAPKPPIIPWKGVNMLRNHSFLKAIDEVIQLVANKDAFRIGIIGGTHSGKTTLAKAISHTLHVRIKEKLNIPFATKFFEKEDLINFGDTLKSLEPANYILTFDDVSFLSAHANKKQLDALKSTLTTIRHIPGGEDVRIISIFPYHYSKALDPYLRQSEFKFVTTISGKTEQNNMIAEFGENNASKIGLFQHMASSAPKTGIFRFRLNYPLLINNAKEYFFTYKYRNPFIPCLFWNDADLRFIVAPTRQFIDPVCSICEIGENKDFKSEVNIDQLITELNNLGPRIVQSALKALLAQQGINTYSKSITGAMKKIDKVLLTKKISLRDLALKCGLEETGQTHISKVVLSVLEENGSQT